MIRIAKPNVEVDSHYAYLKARVEVSKDTSDAYIAAQQYLHKTHWRTNENYPPASWMNDDGLWFSVPVEYKDYLCSDRSDAFVVAMLWYAMITGSDIETEAPVSEKMLFHISRYLIPALCTDENGYQRIKITGPTTDQPYKTIGGVGTGMSCGVDSFYTLHEYTREDIPKKYRLSYLTYFNMGAVFHPNCAEKKEYTIKEFYETTERISEEKREKAKTVAERAGMPLVYVKSNMDSDFYRGAYGYTGVYRNCAMALSLQGLFSVYYCSSGGWPGYFDLSINEGSQHYEGLLCTCLSTESLSFVLSDYATRLEKTITIADDKLAQEFLDVCFCFNSCGKCSKCIRTLVTLDIIGKLDLFGKVFNIDYYKSHREDAFTQILLTKDGDEKEDDAIFAKDIYRIAKEKNIILKESICKYKAAKRKAAVKVLLHKTKRFRKKLSR